MEGKGTCCTCKKPADMTSGRQSYCNKHYRFRQMQATARRRGKAVPHRSVLEAMLPEGMLCPDCGVQMNWRARDGAATVASLQHYRSGEMAIVCRSCNTRHASMDGDSYRDMPKDHKQCPACKEIKPATSFFLDNNRGGVLRRTSYCKPCSQERTRLTRRKIAERKRREAPAGV